jgi:hypothetical protein
MVAANPADLPSDDPQQLPVRPAVINATSSNTSFAPATALSTSTSYFWQVRAEGISGGNWSTKWSFTTENLFPDPVLSSPSNGAIGVPTIPMFRWLEVEDASRYRIMVATSQSILPTGPTDTRCNKCVINTTSTNQSFIPTTVLSQACVLLAGKSRREFRPGRLLVPKAKLHHHPLRQRRSFDYFGYA